MNFNKMAMAVVLICLPMVFFSCKKENKVQVNPTINQINYHFASMAEGQQLLNVNDEFFNSLNQNNIDWRMRRTGATLSELKAYAQTCVRDFSDDEKAAVNRAVAVLQETLNNMGASLPFPDDIAFVRTTMEESDSGQPLFGDGGDRADQPDLRHVALRANRQAEPLEKVTNKNNTTL